MERDFNIASNIIELRLASGAGNRFTIFDNRTAKIPNHILARLTPSLCNAPFLDNLPTEGLITLQSSSNSAEFAASFFNPDGSTGAMCGNGGRCAVKFAKKIGAISESTNIRFSMAGKSYVANETSEGVSLQFSPASKIIENLTLTAFNIELPTIYADVGSDHAVFFYNELKESIEGLPERLADFDLAAFAPTIRNHKSFAPRGVNVNIVEQIPNENGMFRLRTYERGVESETGSCGTGALSSAIAIALRGYAKPPIIFTPTSGRKLIVRMKDDSPRNTLILEGDVIFHDSIYAAIYNDMNIIYSREPILVNFKDNTL